ncbi:MAG: ABC transporter ATP-binding protein [Saprospiraceae bacterium]|nr:ABC transporter ATP-binding protein [Saprospiraceae bacterium]
MIEVNDLNFSYPGSDTEVLKGLNFQIAQGEIYGFLGPSGAGKSTCQKILYKTLTNYRGKITIYNRELSNWDKNYFNYIGVGFELPNHYGKLTARENLELFSSFYSKDKLLPIANLVKLVGLDEEVDKRVSTFSKGMQMRLNYIRAIMHNPDILFFDEPTAGLDPVNAKMIKDHISLLREEGKTIFITTHNMTTADELCDRVAFLVDGEIILTEKPSVLKQRYGTSSVKVELRNGETDTFKLDGVGRNKHFIQFLQTDEVLRIHTMEASLETVFIAVTGKKLL